MIRSSDAAALVVVKKGHLFKKNSNLLKSSVQRLYILCYDSESKSARLAYYPPLQRQNSFSPRRKSSTSTSAEELPPNPLGIICLSDEDKVEVDACDKRRFSLFVKRPGPDTSSPFKVKKGTKNNKSSRVIQFSCVDDDDDDDEGNSWVAAIEECIAELKTEKDETESAFSQVFDLNNESSTTTVETTPLQCEGEGAEVDNNDGMEDEFSGVLEVMSEEHMKEADSLESLRNELREDNLSMKMEIDELRGTLALNKNEEIIRNDFTSYREQIRDDIREIVGHLSLATPSKPELDLEAKLEEVVGQNKSLKEEIRKIKERECAMASDLRKARSQLEKKKEEGREAEMEMAQLKEEMIELMNANSDRDKEQSIKIESLKDQLRRAREISKRECERSREEIGNLEIQVAKLTASMPQNRLMESGKVPPATRDDSSYVSYGYIDSSGFSAVHGISGHSPRRYVNSGSEKPLTSSELMASDGERIWGWSGRSRSVKEMKLANLLQKELGKSR